MARMWSLAWTSGTSHNRLNISRLYNHFYMGLAASCRLHWLRYCVFWHLVFPDLPLLVTASDEGGTECESAPAPCTVFGLCLWATRLILRPVLHPYTSALWRLSMFLPLTLRFATPSTSSSYSSLSSSSSSFSPPLVPSRGSYSMALLSLAYHFSVCPCVQWSAKYHLLRVCLTVFSLITRVLASFRVALPFS